MSQNEEDLTGTVTSSDPTLGEAPAQDEAPVVAPEPAPPAPAAPAVAEGAFVFTDPNGKEWYPVYCHDHDTVGFQPDCEACVSQLGTTLDHARQNEQV